MMMHEGEQQCLHAFISGSVQGVGFRYFVLKTANTYGLTGWVRNKYDGRVETLAEGDLNNLNRFLAALRQGPRGSGVTAVDYTFSKGEGKFNRFNVLSTG